MDLIRIILIVILQSFITVVFWGFAIKLFLKKKRSNILYLMALAWAIAGSAFILNTIYLFLTNKELILALDFLMMFMLLYSQVFILLFSRTLLKSHTIMNFKKQILFLSEYGICIFLVMLIPVLINPTLYFVTEDYAPKWNWIYLVIILIFYCIGIIVPTFLYSINVSKTIKEKSLKDRFNYFFIGYGLIVFAFIGLMLYVSVYTPTLKIIHSIVSLIIVPLSTWLTYKGIVKSL